MDILSSAHGDIPRTTYFYVTSICNSNCAYCVFRRDNKDLPRIAPTYQQIVDIFTRNNHSLLRGTHFVLQGGEFTEHPDYLLIAKFFRYWANETSLLTNCIDGQKVLDSHHLFDHVTISWDGPNHDKIRGAPGNSKEIFAYLHALTPLGLEKTTLQMTLGPWNMKTYDVEKFLEICSLVKVQPRFNVAADTGLLGHGKYKVTEPMVLDILDVVKNWLGEKSLQYKYLRIALGQLPRLPCISTSMYVTILPNFEVRFCQGLPDEEAVMGNLRYTHFNDLWQKNVKKRIEYLTCSRCLLSCNLIGDIKYAEAITKMKGIIPS